MARRKRTDTEPPQEVELTERYGVVLMPEAAVELLERAGEQELPEGDEVFYKRREPLATAAPTGAT